MLILGLETSCDETSAAVVEDGRWVRSNVIASQIELHRKTGGVVPEVAAREHVVKVIPVIQEALDTAGVTFEEIDAIAVTQRPGLIASLLVGTSTANALALISGKPLIPVNHIEGHIYANWLDRGGESTVDSSEFNEFETRPNPHVSQGKAKQIPLPDGRQIEGDIQFPVVILTVSGGHNELVVMRGHGDFEEVGATRDDAAGEAFDKVARLLGLPYPGGPPISKLAQQGDRNGYALPRAWMGDSEDFSFSGLKSAVRRIVQTEGDALRRADMAASFQEAVVDVLSAKLIRVAQRLGAREVHLAGGVSANRRLRVLVQERLNEAYENAPESSTPTFRFPEKIAYCTDNAAMIAAAGYFQYQKNPDAYTQWQPVEASTRFEF